MKKNCNNCRHLEYYEGCYESSEASGFCCNKRESAKGSEDELLRLLDTEKYRNKAKVCCKLHPVFTRAEAALLRLVERVSSEYLDISQKALIKELKNR